MADWKRFRDIGGILLWGCRRACPERPDGSPYRGISGTAGALALAAGLLTGGPAMAGEVLVDFEREELAGPQEFTGAQTVTTGGVTLSGGQLLTERPGLPNQTTVYGSAAWCGGCSTTVTLDFAEPVSNVSLSLMNDTIFNLPFIVTDNHGRRAAGTRTVPNRGRAATFTLSGGNITRVTVRLQLAFPSFHNFYIDDIRFEVPDLDYTVSFSAFVPHDNVPGGPGAWCRTGTGRLPPGLLARGGPRHGRSRWLRDVAWKWPDDGDGHGQGGGHGRGREQEHENGHEDGHAMAGVPSGRPFHLGDEDNDGRPRQRRLYFAGDSRGFLPGAESYRLRQLVTVVPEESRDADGLREGSVLNLAGETRVFADDAMADGVIDAADEDGVANDCAMFHSAYRAEPDAMSVTVERVGPNTVAVHLAGTLDTPLLGPARTLGAIDWDLAVTVEKRGERTHYTVSGAHDGFPAWELYINGVPIYRMDPGAPPYRFSRHMRKLLPPLDQRIAGVSGELR